MLGFAVQLDLRLAIWEAVALLVLFAAQFPFPQTNVRLLFSAAYAVIALVVIVRRRAHLPALARETFAGFF